MRCATEEEVYATLGLPYIEPELREGRGELEAALKDELPRLVTLEDLRGDLHSHTTLSDGNQDTEKMAEGARKRGYEYLAITDHSASHGFGNHVDVATLEQQIERVRALNASFGDDFELLIGTETNILPDGSLDYPDELLAELDWVVASVHTAFQMSADDMTGADGRRRRAPARRRHRPPDRAQDRDALAVRGRHGEASSPRPRRRARCSRSTPRPTGATSTSSTPARPPQAGVLIVIDSDAHSVRNLELMRYGVATARRAWLTPEQVANTRPWAELAQLRKRSRAAA